MFRVEDLVDKNICVECLCEEDWNRLIDYCEQELDDNWGEDRGLYDEDGTLIGFWHSPYSSNRNKVVGYYLTQSSDDYWRSETIPIEQCEFLLSEIVVDLDGFEELVIGGCDV